MNFIALEYHFPYSFLNLMHEIDIVFYLVQTLLILTIVCRKIEKKLTMLATIRLIISFFLYLILPLLK